MTHSLCVVNVSFLSGSGISHGSNKPINVTCRPVGNSKHAQDMPNRLSKLPITPDILLKLRAIWIYHDMGSNHCPSLQTQGTIRRNLADVSMSNPTPPSKRGRYCVGASRSLVLASVLPSYSGTRPGVFVQVHVPDLTIKMLGRWAYLRTHLASISAVRELSIDTKKVDSGLVCIGNCINNYVES